MRESLSDSQQAKLREVYAGEPWPGYYASAHDLWAEYERAGCRICLDVRWIKGEHPALVPCPACVSATADHRNGYSELPEPLRGHTFQNFRPRPGLDEAINRVRSYANGDRPNKWLVLAGTVGTGKTHLAVAVINYRAANPSMPAGKYCKVPAFLNEMRDSYGAQDGIHRALVDKLQRAPLLVLDDLGAGKQTEWVDEQIYLLLDYRYERMMETVVTTNVPLTSFEPRIRDRLQSIHTKMSDVHTLTIKSYR